MSRRTRLASAAALALACAAPWGRADTPATQPATYNDEIQALRARLDQLEAKQQEAARQQQEAAVAREEANTTGQVLNDAQRHDVLLEPEGFTAGFKDNRFVIQSADGNYVFRPWLHFQLRDITLTRQEFKHDGGDDTENGLELRRMRWGFDGNAFSPDFTYFFNWATVRANGTATVTSSTGAKVGTVSNSLGGAPLLEEAWVKYKFPKSDFYIKAGQIKDPVLHDQIVSSRYQQTTERSLTGDIFTNGDAFTEGVTVIWDPKTWIRTETGINHGLRSANTNFLGPSVSGNAFNYGLVGRVEAKAFGRWQDYSQIGAVGTKEPLLVFGFGTDYSERGHSGQTVFALDGMYADPSGLSVYGAYVGRYTSHNFGIATQSATGASFGTPSGSVADRATYEYSLLAQAGYNIDQHWEPFGRWEFIHIAGTPAGSHDFFNEFTAGVNYYFYGHRAKITAQAMYLPQGIPIDDSPNDVFTDNGHGEFAFVAQFQLLL